MKKRITQQDYLKANRKAAREEEIAAHGKSIVRTRIHQSRKTCNRNRAKAGLRKGLPDFFRFRLQTVIRRHERRSHTYRRSEKGFPILFETL